MEIEKGRDEFTELEKEYREINDELVVPSYRRFCEDLDIPFHFWDELPQEEHDPRISLDELPLHKEAMDLFNRLKPELSLFKGKVVRFQFKSWDGGFTYTTIPINEFFDEVADQIFFLNKLEHRFHTVSQGLAFSAALVSFVLAIILTLRLVPWDSAKQASILTALLLAVLLYYWLERRIRRLPRRILEDGKLDGVAERLQNLQKRLAEIRGSRPNPLRQKRLGQLILDDVQQFTSTADIERFVRRLRSNLYLVPRDKE